MGAPRSHSNVKIHLSDFIWTKCIYVHLTSISLFVCCGDERGGALFYWEKLASESTVSVVFPSKAQSEGFG